MDARQRAIEIVESSRESHVGWLNWREKGNDDEPGCGDARFHTECIEGYDHVLAVLRNHARPTGGADPLPNCGEVDARRILFDEIMEAHRSLHNPAIRGLAMGSAILRYFDADPDERRRQEAMFEAERGRDG